MYNSKVVELIDERRKIRYELTSLTQALSKRDVKLQVIINHPLADDIYLDQGISWTVVKAAEKTLKDRLGRIDQVLYETEEVLKHYADMTGLEKIIQDGR